MVTGDAKRLLSEKGSKFDMATLIVIAGTIHSIHPKAKEPIVIILLKSELGRANIEFSFDE